MACTRKSWSRPTRTTARNVRSVIDSRKYDTSIRSAVEPLEAEGEWVVQQMVDVEVRTVSSDGDDRR